MRKIKVFISVGMRGRTVDAVMNDIQMATADILYGLKEDQVEIVHTFVTTSPDDNRRLACLGESIKILGECDACYFVDGWHNYHGCVVERKVCEEYGITMLKPTEVAYRINTMNRMYEKINNIEG